MLPSSSWLQALLEGSVLVVLVILCLAVVLLFIVLCKLQQGIELINGD